MIYRFLEEIGSVFSFLSEITRQTLRRRASWGSVLGQVAEVSFRSLPTIAFSGVFVGAILVLQFNQMLAEFEAQSLLGGLNTSAIIREVGPLIISFLLAGKIGAYTAAELGTMKVTDQFDAIRCLGHHPIPYLVIPRFFGIIISSSFLLVAGLFVSVLGSLWVAQEICGVNQLQFLASIPRFVSGWTFFCGASKCFLYSTIVATISCYQGYATTGGAQGVGRAVTRAALVTNFCIVLANFFSSKVLGWIHFIWFEGGWP